ncbi:MAG: L-rhamnose mutarotase [Flammeovirgaceae bacterium]|nr:L-rhamnose mutarotase [Flammeovirgaceae bacterium]
MKVFAQTLNLKDDPEVIRQYIEYHKSTWPEVLKSLQSVGVLDMKIFLLGRRLFMYMTAIENFNPNVDFPRYLTLDPKCQEWEDLMGTFQVPVEDAKEGEKWAMMDQVFDMEAQLKAL